MSVTTKRELERSRAPMLLATLSNVGGRNYRRISRFVCSRTSSQRTEDGPVERDIPR